MEKIQEIWFEKGRIFMLSSTGNTFSRPLEAFPLLKDADNIERQKFHIWGNGEYVSWRGLDVDISVDSFMETTEPNSDNEISNIFKRCPCIDIEEFAKYVDIPKHVLDRLIYGIWTPKEETISKIKDGIKAMISEMQSVAC